jgi:hypothetical protein
MHGRSVSIRSGSVCGKMHGGVAGPREEASEAIDGAKSCVQIDLACVHFAAVAEQGNRQDSLGSL